VEYEREEEEALPSSLTTNDQGAALPTGQSASYFFVSRAVFGRVLFSLNTNLYLYLYLYE